MKLIRVTHILEATIGGTRSHFLQIAKHIDKNRFQLSFILSPLRDPKTTKRDAEFLQKCGFKVELVEMSREISVTKDLKSLVALTKIIRRLQPDIVHTHASKGGILGRVAAKLAGIPYCFHTPHLWPFDWEKNLLRRGIFRGLERTVSCISDEIIAVSEDQKMAALQNRIVPKNKIFVLNNATQEFQKAEFKARESEFVFGFAGRLVDQKGIDVLISAFEEISSQIPNSILLIGGSGRLLHELEDQANSTSCGDKIKFVGEIEHIEDFLSRLDAFILPSRWEGYPYSILEAMAMLTPVIASKIGGVSEIVFPNFNGRLFEKDSHTELAQSMLDLYNDEEKTRTLAENAFTVTSRNLPSQFCRALEWRYLRTVNKQKA